jgi:hypothetical protein
MKITYETIEKTDYVKITCGENDDYMFNCVMGELENNSLGDRIETISRLLNNTASAMNGIDSDFRLKVWAEFVRQLNKN